MAGLLRYATVVAVAVAVVLMLQALGVRAGVPVVWNARLPASSQVPPPRHTLYADPSSATSGVYLGGASIFGLGFKDGSTEFGPVGSHGQYFSRAVLPTVDGQSYFVVVNASRNGQGEQAVTAFSTASGTVAWTVQQSFVSSLVLDKEHGVVHMEVPVDKAIGLDARTGTQVSSAQLGSASTLLAAAGGQLLVLKGRGQLVSISATSGAQAWSLSTSISTANPQTCAFAGGVWYVVGQESAFAGAGAVFLAVDASSGAQVFLRTFAAATVSAPVVQAGVVFSALTLSSNLRASHGSVVALEASTGRTLWLYNATTVVGQDVACDGDSVYFTTTPAKDAGAPVFNLVALDAASGAQRWSFLVPTSDVPPGALSNYEVSQPLALQWGGLVLVSLYDGNGGSGVATVYAVSNSSAV